MSASCGLRHDLMDIKQTCQKIGYMFRTVVAGGLEVAHLALLAEALLR